MADLLKKHPAILVAILGALTTMLVRVSSKLGLPLSDQMAGELAHIVLVFGLAFVGYLAAHAHGGQMGEAFSGALGAGTQAAEQEAESDLGGQPIPPGTNAGSTASKG